MVPQPSRDRGKCGSRGTAQLIRRYERLPYPACFDRSEVTRLAATCFQATPLPSHLRLQHLARNQFVPGRTWYSIASRYGRRLLATSARSESALYHLLLAASITDFNGRKAQELCLGPAYLVRQHPSASKVASERRRRRPPRRQMPGRRGGCEGKVANKVGWSQRVRLCGAVTRHRVGFALHSQPLAQHPLLPWHYGATV